MSAARLQVLISYRDDMQYQIVFIYPRLILCISCRDTLICCLLKLEFEFIHEDRVLDFFTIDREFHSN